MIGRLTGTVLADEPTGAIVLDVQGVGYELLTPVGTRGRAKATPDGKLVLFTYLHVREGIMELYGFSSDSERQVFRRLITVPNVGPKTALGVLSALPAAELAGAVDAGDVARLTRVPGIGKRTAERLVMELKDKLEHLHRAPAPAAGPPDQTAKLVSALTNMGYKAAEAEKAVKVIADRIGKEPIAELLRAALAQL
jgi:Holliday junction DNA helicase RuvA